MSVLVSSFSINLIDIISTIPTTNKLFIATNTLTWATHGHDSSDNNQTLLNTYRFHQRPVNCLAIFLSHLSFF
ncbi:hypothetical protein CLAVI_000419 [Candidatus Clavichlamydia salmonicola]|uniref:hypothetical protein n=1 Tax=Candidatus Clavichlamydia salmonicola TaxID=469812 RepID=UPI0018911042|nr:hypothetical protein [Candidatus Clavichlamydia salmonicola]MBF5050800.1 hypothetical protein [Candidatus Clavichlamydia salmonicola]